MEPLPLNDEEFLNHGVSYEFLNNNVKFFDELMNGQKTVNLVKGQKLTEAEEKYLNAHKNIKRDFEKTGKIICKIPITIHQLPHMQNMAQTLVEIQKDFFVQKIILL